MYSKIMGGAAQPPRAMGAAGATGLASAMGFDRFPEKEYSDRREYMSDLEGEVEAYNQLLKTVPSAVGVSLLLDLLKRGQTDEMVGPRLRVDIPAQSAAQPGDEVPFDAPADMSRLGSAYDMIGGR